MRTNFIKITSILLFFIFQTLPLIAQTQDIQIDSKITSVQPMTGIVLWTDHANKSTDAISLEYSALKYSDIVKTKGVYNWTKLETILNGIASRNHQAIIRLYFTHPGQTSAVPDYIKKTTGYVDFKGTGDGSTCYFPDWRSKELQNFALDFYTKFAAKYDKDPRIAFIQTGFGLWSEYHAYSSSIILNGKTYKDSQLVGIGFPSKEFQKTFLKHLNSVFINTPWSISIDAASGSYSPMASSSELRNLNYGLFDDSFMCEGHDGYNKDCWTLFGSDRYKKSPCGGEFNYYTTQDQKEVLNPAGWRGRTYEQAATQYHISYMLGNNQPSHQSMARIKEASMASGYKFKLVSFKTSSTQSKVTIKNIGVAPFYFDAYISVNGVRSSQSLKGLCPNESKEFTVASGGNNPKLKIVSDRLLAGQTIQFEGNASSTQPPSSSYVLLRENFDYSVSNNTNLEGKGGWVFGTSGGTTPAVPVINSGSLSYPGYAEAGIGKSVRLTATQGSNSKDFRTSYKAFTNNVTSGTVYVAFMVKVSSAANKTGRDFICLDGSAGTANRGRVFVSQAETTGKIQFWVSKNSTTKSKNISTELDMNKTHLLVLKYTFDVRSTGINDDVCLYVNPKPGTLESNYKALQADDNKTQTDLNKVTGIDLKQRGNGIAIAGIRVATTWSNAVAATSSTKISTDMIVKAAGFDNEKMDPKTPISEQYYNITGRSVSSSEPGIIIKATIYDDGTIETSKIINK